MLDLSIVIINHHHRGMIEKCIDTLVRLPDEVKFEVLVIDNTPSDGLANWIKENVSNVSLLANRYPLGYAANANLGIRTAVNGRYAMMLNPDIICVPGLLKTLVAFMDDNPDVGLAAPKLLNPDGTLQPSCRRFPNPLTLAIRFCRQEKMFSHTSLLRSYLMTDWDHATAADVDWVTGAAMIFRRAALAAVGAMDETYFMYWEDLDLCLRLWHSGCRVCYVPEACATHAHLRQGVREPFSRFSQWQIAGAINVFRKFGLNLGRRATSY